MTRNQIEQELNRLYREQEKAEKTASSTKQINEMLQENNKLSEELMNKK